MSLHLLKKQFQKFYSVITILSLFYICGCNLPNKEKAIEKMVDENTIKKITMVDENTTKEITEEAEADTKGTINEHLFDSFIGKDKEYVKKNANQFIEKEGHYIIVSPDTQESDDWVEVIFNEKNEAEFFVWNYGKSLDPLESSDYSVSTVLGPKRLGLSDNHRIKKKGNLIRNYMATVYDDDIMCLYNFNGDFYLKCGLSKSFSEYEVQLIDTIWRISYYVDEFGIPGEKAYITNSKEIVGRFNNSATTNSKLKVSILFDSTIISFKLYEYGQSLVKNSSTRNNDTYKIIMLDSQNQKITFEGTMSTNSDRISVSYFSFGKGYAEILRALLQNGPISFYIEKKDRPTTNYTFTIPSNNGFPAVQKLFLGKPLD